jgi:acetyl-CoA carboxylase biotin carboxyl carrier protein
MKLSEIQDLIKFVAKSGVSEVELQTKDVKILIKTPGSKSGLKNGDAPIIIQSQPVPATQPVVTVPAVETAAAETKKSATPADDDSKYITIKSPMIGTMYRSAGPDKPPFVNVGDEIKPGKVICIIEAMKLFNEIESDISGKIVKVLVNDSTPVEYDQPLFLIDPS